MIYLALAKLLMSIAANFIAIARDRQLLDAGSAQEVARNLNASFEIMDRASRARDNATADFDRRNGVPDENDPNLRD